jgi:hypothetical protein
VQYKTAGADNNKIAEERILQWLSAPSGDLLILRDQAHLRPTAIRDSFYPVVHHFDLPDGGVLPDKLDDVEGAVFKSALNRETLPKGYKAWTCFDE